MENQKESSNRSDLLKLNTDMRWKRYGLVQKLSYLQSRIDDAMFYIKNPLELKRKYSDVIDYTKKWLKSRYGDNLKFTTEKEMLEFLLSERTMTHIELRTLKVERKQVKDKLSKIPKTKNKGVTPKI